MLRICYVKDEGSTELTFAGTYSLEQVERAFAAVLDGTEDDCGKGLIVDATDSETEFTEQELRTLADFLARRRERLGHRMAVVVAVENKVHYATSRMLAAYAEPMDLVVGVFTDMDEAARWIAPS
jgi:hypothetical protein